VSSVAVLVGVLRVEGAGWAVVITPIDTVGAVPIACLAYGR
jgi:hypothetical protein